MNKQALQLSYRRWHKRRHTLQSKLNQAKANKNQKWVGIYATRLKHAVEMEHRREKQIKSYNAAHPMMWMPGAIRHPLNDAGPMAQGYPARGVLHTTESHGDATATLAAKDAAPQFEVTFDGKILQYIALDRAGRALQHTGPAETNRANCIQIEIANFAAHGGQIDDNHPQARALRKLMRFIEENAGVARAAHYKFSDNGQGVRLTETEWRKAQGWLGHMHVPGNIHWDPGGLEIHKFL